MTLPGPGNQLTLAQINAEFGYGFDLNSYRGRIWYYDNGQAGIFPVQPNPISFYDFYSKRSKNPVTPTTVTFTSNGTFIVPSVYTTMTVTVRGGGGGAGGSNGSVNCGSVQGITYGSDGLSGNSSSLQILTSPIPIFIAASGGSGGRATGTSGVNGSPQSDGTPAGGVGTNGGGSGGAGGYEIVVLISPSAGGSGPNPGSSLAVTVGSGGLGGKGGPNSQLWSGICTISGYSTSGQNGSDGSVVIQWS